MRNANSRKVLVRIAAAAALPVLGLSFIGNALAGPPHQAKSTVTRTGPAGNTASRASQVATNGQGGYSASSTVTGPAGNQPSRQQLGAYNPATQTYTRSGGTTGPAGNSTSFSTAVTNTGNGYQRSATHTGPNGQSAMTTGGASYNAATGQVTQNRSVKGPNGNGPSESRTVTTSASNPSN